MGKKTYTISEFKAIKNPKFAHYRGLRSGKDDYTHKKLSELEDIVKSKGIYIPKEDHCDTKYAAILRWVLRGLTLEEAKHKLSVDAEISQNAIMAHKNKLSS